MTTEMRTLAMFVTTNIRMTKVNKTRINRMIFKDNCLGSNII